MQDYISLFILIPLFGFILNSILPNRDEKRLAQVSFIMLAVQFLSVLGFTIWWMAEGAKPIYKVQVSFIELSHLQLYIDFVYDEITAIFLLTGAFIAFLITAYSRNYLHREAGFKRFFTTILFFYLGYNLIVLSGNLTTIFVGWEIAGISSFLLIAYYRNRYIPVKNAVMIFSVYRLGDVALMLAMWLGHHIWHANVSLHQYNDQELVLHHIAASPGYSVAFAVCIFIAAAIKSAQFPFSAWLPRAMEGPTPSSAIFYSSLAVHLGILVLLRTYSFWILIPWMKELVIISGSFSFLLSIFMARIQPSVKGQIAYAVVAQTGLMAIEIALGWHTLTLIHFASHAMLRSYQLLISPSVISYEMKRQFYEFKPVNRKRRPAVLQNISNTIYILSLNEWYLDKLMYYMAWGTFKKAGTFLHIIPRSIIKWGSFVLVVAVPALAVFSRMQLLGVTPDVLVYVFLSLALVYILRTFTEKEKVLYAWYKIGAFHVFLVSAMYANGLSVQDLLLYTSGIAVSYFLGHFVLNNIRRKEKFISLDDYQGHCYEYPMTEFWFFLASLGLMGFPITPAFLGMELMLSGVKETQPVLMAMLLIALFVNALSMIRMYARIFLGPHIKTYHTSARKSS